MRLVKIAVVGLLLVGACSAGDEPTFEGRSVDRWMMSLKAPLAGERRKACQAMGAFGSKAEDAVPQLVKLLADRDGDVQLAASEALGKIGPAAIGPIEQVLNQSDLIPRLYAAIALVKIKPEHEQAVGIIMEGFTGVGNARLAEHARQAVLAMGAPFVPRVQKLLADPYVPVRTLAVETLGNMAEMARAAVPDVIKQLEHTDPTVRIAALKALAKIGPKEAVVPAITGLTKDKNEDVAGVATEMLAYFPPTEAAPAK